MTSLIDLLGGGRDPAHPLVVTPDETLTLETARTFGPAGDLDVTDVVLVSIKNVTALVRCLVALDGQVGALLLVSTSQSAEVIAELSTLAGASRIVTDRDDLPGEIGPIVELVVGPADVLGAPKPARARTTNPARARTTWMMTTSGTTGIPKIVPHTLASLARTVRPDPLARTPVWGLVYEMTRFAGLQVGLQSLIGGGTLSAPDTHAPLSEQIAHMAASGCSHLSATPTLWRRLMMAPEIKTLALRQITLGGEIADQVILDAVSARFPDARVTHIYASTEAGVGFAVNDRKAGFPLAYLDAPPGGVGMKILNDMLWLRPPDGRTVHYLGAQEITVDDAGYVLTGDRIEQDGARAFFLGRDSGVVNVGGVKVYPERVERTIAATPGVGLVQVNARKSPITGALLVATVVPSDPDADRDALKTAILATCRATLEREAVPARLLFAERLDTNAAGKIVRT